MLWCVQFFTVALLSLSLSLKGENNETPVPENIPKQIAPTTGLLVNSNNLFSFDLYKELRTQKGNLFFSPYSIFLGFGMAATGAKGETLIEMQRVLHTSATLFGLANNLNQQLLYKPKNQKTGSELVLAEALWVQKDFLLKPEFVQNFKKAGVSIDSLDFTQEPVLAVKTINQWVQNQTRGKIRQLFTRQDVTSDTRLVITNAIYMKGQWAKIFDLKNTKKAPFYSINKKELPVDMMNVTSHFSLFTDPRFDLIALPYEAEEDGPQLVMFIILPKEADAFDAIEKEWTYDNWNNWITNLKPRHVNLSLPRFKVEELLDLNAPMQEMGMQKAFSPNADFSGIADQKLFISRAVHKGYVKVDEKGTEAAAATGISMNLTAILEPVEAYNMNVDHPFLFCILDRKTETLIFMDAFCSRNYIEI